MLETSASAWTVTEPGIYQVRRPLARMGAPYGQYLLDDVLRGRVHSKLYVFLNAWQLSAAQRKALRRQPAWACRVWCYAPGLHDGDRTSPEAMRELTGFRLVPVSPAQAWATPTAAGKQLGLQTAFGVEGPVTPLFAAADASPDETLATYPDGSAAVALRKAAGGWSLFVGAPGLTSDLLRLAARKGRSPPLHARRTATSMPTGRSWLCTLPRTARSSSTLVSVAPSTMLSPEVSSRTVLASHCP